MTDFDLGWPQEPLWDCNCDENGASSTLCSSSGQCTCKTGYTGQTCSSCSSGYYKSGSYCYGEICLFIIIQL